MKDFLRLISLLFLLFPFLTMGQSAYIDNLRLEFDQYVDGVKGMTVFGMTQKIRIKLAKAYKRAVREKKEDYIHSVVNQLLERYDIIGIENLNVKGAHEEP